MNGEDFEEFLRVMFDVAELYDKQPPTSGAMKHYFAALSQLTLEEAGDLIDYYRDRNKQAAESHRKTWLAKHPNVARKK